MRLALVCFVGRGSLLIVSAALCIAGSAGELAGSEYRLDSNEVESVRNTALLWVQQERLPPPETPLSAEDEARFAKAWARWAAACRNVTDAWARAFQADPLLERAADCLQRYVELEWQFNLLRNDLRREHGNDGFRVYERRGAAWVKTNGQPWLNLEDTNLVRLYLRGLFLAHAKETTLDGEIRSPSYEWMLTTEPFADELPDKNEELTEQRAVEICRAAITRQRVATREEQEQLAETLDLPPRMWRYLAIRNEADYLAFLGSTYLALNVAKHEDIATAEAEFHAALEQVASIRPDAMTSLCKAHEELFKSLATEKARQYAAFRASVGEAR